MYKTSKLKPFIKIAGGKSRMLSTLHSHLPEDFSKKSYTYLEPFIGGGSFALSLLDRFPDLNHRLMLNDFNFDIFNAWVEVRENVFNLMDELEEYSKNHCRGLFDQIRGGFVEFPSIEHSQQPLPENFFLDRAAKFIYLNKTCFNGLIRYNRSGKFNSPFGKYVKPRIYNKDNLIALNQALATASINCDDFDKFVRGFVDSPECVPTETFIYMDPPYIPQSITASFTDYTYKGFNLKDQERLRDLMLYLDNKGIKFLVSNSDTDLSRHLYSPFDIHEVFNNRSISATTARGKVRELLVRNY